MLMTEIKDLIKGRHTIFMDWKTPDGKDVKSLQIGVRFDTIPIKSQQDFFADTYKIILKCIQKGNRTKIIKTILEEEEIGKKQFTQFQDIM